MCADTDRQWPFRTCRISIRGTSDSAVVGVSGKVPKPHAVCGLYLTRRVDRSKPFLGKMPHPARGIRRKPQVSQGFTWNCLNSFPRGEQCTLGSVGRPSLRPKLRPIDAAAPCASRAELGNNRVHGMCRNEVPWFNRRWRASNKKTHLARAVLSALDSH